MYIKIANMEYANNANCLIMERYKDAHYESTPEAIASGIAVHWYGVIIIPDDYSGDRSEMIRVTVQGIRYEAPLSEFMTPSEDGVEFTEAPPDKMRKLVIAYNANFVDDGDIVFQETEILEGSFELKVGDDSHITRLIQTTTIENYESGESELFNVSDLEEGEWVELLMPVWEDDDVSYTSIAKAKAHIGILGTVQQTTSASWHISTVLATPRVAFLDLGGDNITIASSLIGVKASEGQPQIVYSTGILYDIAANGNPVKDYDYTMAAEVNYRWNKAAHRGIACYIDLGITGETDQYVWVWVNEQDQEPWLKDVFLSSKPKYFKELEPISAAEIAKLPLDSIYVKTSEAKALMTYTYAGDDLVPVYIVDESEDAGTVKYGRTSSK